MHPTRTRRRIAAVAVAATTTLTVLTIGPEARAQTVGVVKASENYRLGGGAAGRGRDAPALATNPTNHQHIVEVEKDILRQDCLAHVSTDGGATWTSSGYLPTPPGFPAPGSPVTLPSCPSWDATVEFGSGQNVYSAFASARATAHGRSVIVVRSADGGRTWTPVVAMDNPGAATPAYSSPEVGVHRGAGAGGADRIYVQAEAGGQVWVSVSNDGGATWSAPVVITGAGTAARSEATKPVVNSDGTVSVGYRQSDPNPPSGPAAVTGVIYVARAAFPATAWSQTAVTPVRGYVDEAGSRFNRSNNPRMAGAPNGALYITYMEGPPPGGRQDHFIHPDVDVMFVRSTDYGATWSAPLRVNDDPPGLGAPATGPAQRHPRIAVAPNGRVDIVWQDRRHGYRSPTHSHLGNGEARMGDTYIAHSSDNGASFSKNRRISDKTQNLDIGYDHYGEVYWSWGPALTHIGNDQVLFAWQDSREGNYDDENEDIYLSKVNVQSPDAIPVQRLPQTSRPSLAVAVSRYAYQGGPQAVLNVGFTNRPISRPVVVNEGDPAGALAGAVLSRAFLAPLLTVPATALPADVAAEVKRMSPIGAFLVGGESSLTAGVVNGLVGAGVPAEEVVRLGGATAADTAKAVALALDRRTDAQKSAGAPAFDAVVVVNAASREAAAAAGMASALRLPVLFAEQGGIPAATREALSALNITSTLVVGGSGVISDAVVASLPGAKRLGGADPFAVSKAVVAESVARRMATNIVHVADTDQPIDAALLGSAVGRVNGLLLLTPGADTAVANQALADLGLRAGVDRLVVGQSFPSGGPGYRLAARDGGVFSFGGAQFYGSTGAIRLAQPMVGITNTPSGNGYWMVAADGGVFAFGDARFRGSTGALRLAQPVVGMAPTPSGNGYWLVARDGGIFAFGDAQFYGSTGAIRLNQPIVGMAPTRTGRGYWLTAADGGVFAFGDAVFRGSTGAIRLNQPVVGMAATPSGNGYWLVARDGGIFAFGDAVFRGSTGAIRLAQPVVGMDATSSGNGYYLVASDGGVFAFGDARFAGSMGAIRLNQPVVGIDAGA